MSSQNHQQIQQVYIHQSQLFTKYTTITKHISNYDSCQIMQCA